MRNERHGILRAFIWILFVSTVSLVPSSAFATDPSVADFPSFETTYFKYNSEYVKFDNTPNILKEQDGGTPWGIDYSLDGGTHWVLANDIRQQVDGFICESNQFVLKIGRKILWKVVFMDTELI